VRLYFAELQDAAEGERVFDVSLQGAVVLPAFDIVKAAGGPRRTIVREFSGIEVASALEMTLTPSKDCAIPRPLLSGVEVVAEEE
jgi:hypothetical protein